MHQDYYFTGDSTQDGILKAALETFAIFGYKKTAMSDISDRAGVSRPTLYTYFKNKESIFFAVTEGIHKSVIDEVQLALGPPATLEENLTSAFEEWTRPLWRSCLANVRPRAYRGGWLCCLERVKKCTRALSRPTFRLPEEA